MSKPDSISAAERLLHVHGLGVAVQGQQVLTDVSFDVSESTCVGLVGETGSGKSMTCRTLIGLLHRVSGYITAGELMFLGRDLRRLDEAGWRRLRGHEIAFVPQSSLSGLNPVRRVGVQLREAVRTLDEGSDPSRRSAELLQLVHMPRERDVLGLYPHELSGGMRQRVMIALALAGRPRLLLADEPTTALDVTVQRGILALLNEIRRNTGLGMVFVSHDLAVVRSVAQQVVVMYGGSVVERGPAAEILSRPRHPYTRALMDAAEMMQREGRFVALSGSAPSAGEQVSGCQFAPRCSFAAEDCRRVKPTLETVTEDHAVACLHSSEIDLDRHSRIQA